MAEIIYLPELIRLWQERFEAQVRRSSAGQDEDADWFDDYIVYGEADPDDPYREDDEFPEWSPMAEAITELVERLLCEYELPSTGVIFCGHPDGVEVIQACLMGLAATEIEAGEMFPSESVLATHQPQMVVLEAHGAHRTEHRIIITADLAARVAVDDVDYVIDSGWPEDLFSQGEADARAKIARANGQVFRMYDESTYEELPK